MSFWNGFIDASRDSRLEVPPQATPLLYYVQNYVNRFYFNKLTVQVESACMCKSNPLFGGRQCIVGGQHTNLSLQNCTTRPYTTIQFLFHNEFQIENQKNITQVVYGQKLPFYKELAQESRSGKLPYLQ